MALFCAAVFFAVCTVPLTGANASGLPENNRQPSFIIGDGESAIPYKPKRLRIADELEAEDLSPGKISYYGNKLLRYAEDKPSGWPGFHEELLLVHSRELPKLHADTSEIRVSPEIAKTDPDNVLIRRISPPYEDNTAGIYLPHLALCDTGCTVYPASTVPYGFEDGTVYSLSSETPADPRILSGLRFILENAPPYKSYCCYPGDYEAASRTAAALAIRAYIRWCTAGENEYDSFINLAASDLRTFPPDYLAYLYFLYDGAISAANDLLSSGTNVILLESVNFPDYPVVGIDQEIAGITAGQFQGRLSRSHPAEIINPVFPEIQRYGYFLFRIHIDADDDLKIPAGKSLCDDLFSFIKTVGRTEFGRLKTESGRQFTRNGPANQRAGQSLWEILFAL